jgi:hypothetical protein
MSFKPSEITKDHVRKGLEEIKKSDIPLHNGTRWQVVIDGKPYPPKEVMRFARKEYDKSNDWPYGGGPSTNKFLEKMGFEIKEISDNMEEQINFDPYFNIPGIWEYQKVADTKYDSSKQEAEWYYDTRMKLYYLIKLISNRLGEQFDLVYTEQPNAQKGRGKINFKNYILAGFAPKPNFGDDIFMKLSFTNLKENPHFALDIDINFRKGNSRYASRREEIYHSNYIQWKIGEDFPNNWTDLLDLISPHVLNLFKKFKEYISEFTPNTLSYSQMNLSNKNASLNQILYGPPGTGKTYNTINKSLELIGESIEGKTRNQVKDIFEKKVKEGQIVFSTFHQNMSYEDFIEGIKPITVDNKVIYKIERGIFKNLCIKASEKKTSRNFDESYSKFVEDVLAKGSILLETPTHKKKFKVIINSNETAVAIPETEKGTNMGVTKEMSRDYVINGNIKDWKPYTTAIGEYIKKEYHVDIEDTDNSNKNFVLIIDEINRGNVSKIFGELITLIEESKRTGRPEAITAILPYSKEEFSIPENVYILGTMNTADRSVEALDTALRRRFDFVEMMPKYDLIEEEDNEKYFLNEIFVFDILETINKRIEVLLGRDHLIGHSFFLLDEVETIDNKLKSAFYKNIIPLLQEYFYGDYNKIGLVLGSGFVTKIKVENHKELFADSKDFNGNDYINGDSYNYSIAEFKDDETFYNALEILMNKSTILTTNE